MMQMSLLLGGTGVVLGHTVKAPSTLGTFLRSFRFGHVRQLNRVSCTLLARAWGTDAGPGEGPFTIDVDSTICETYGLAKEGGQHHTLSTVAVPSVSRCTKHWAPVLPESAIAPASVSTRHSPSRRSSLRKCWGAAARRLSCR